MSENIIALITIIYGVIAFAFIFLGDDWLQDLGIYMLAIPVLLGALVCIVFLVLACFGAVK